MDFLVVCLLLSQLNTAPDGGTEVAIDEGIAAQQSSAETRWSRVLVPLLRKGPSNSTMVVFLPDCDESLQLLRIQGGWAEVSQVDTLGRTRTGWILESLLTDNLEESEESVARARAKLAMLEGLP